MHPIITILLGNTAVALLLAAAALAARLCRRPAVAHVLWLLVIVKLITPPLWRVVVATAPAELAATSAPPATIADPVVWSEGQPAPSSGSPTERGKAARGARPSGVASIRQSVSEVIPSSAEPRRSPLEATLSPPSRAAGASTSTLILCVWAAGSFAYLAIALVRLRRFDRLLGACDDAIDAPLRRQIGDLSARIGLSRPPNARLFRGRSVPLSPMIYFSGLRRPLLILPAAMMESLDSDRAGVIAHELAHLRRGDHWVRLVELLATTLLWWHPLLWLARRGLHEAEEQCCDAWAVSVLSPERARRTYADALVGAVSLLAAGRSGSRHAGALPAVASGLGQLKHLKRRLVMIMKHRIPRSISRMGRVAVVAMMLVALPIVPAVAQDASSGSAAKDEEIRQLRQRVAQLEKRLDAAEKALANATTAATPAAGVTAAPAAAAVAAGESPAVTPEQRDVLKAKARQRARRDSQKYKPAELADCEQLYQVANANWRSPQAITSLEQMIEKYPDVNRTGCAVLYLGQMSDGDTREQYLKRAVEKHSDCFYFNGVQVGGYARYLLAMYYRDTGKAAEADTLLKEILTKYPDSITHGGDKLALIVKESMAGTTRPAAAK